MTLKSGLEVTQSHSNRYYSKVWVGFLFAFYSNYGSILHYLRDKAIYWSKIVIFFIPLAFDAPVRGVPVGIFPSRLVWKNENGGATRQWKIFADICNRSDTIPACDKKTDRQTDEQTSCHGIVRAMHTCRAVINVRTTTK